MAEPLGTSVVVPVHNNAALTRRCLDDLLDAYGDTIEVVVVDDGSSDSTPRLLDAYSERVRVVRHDANGGFAAACNSGARAASGRRLVFLNNDTVGSPGWLEALIAASEARPEAGAIGARLLFPDGTVQHAGVVFSQELRPYHAFAGFPGDHPSVTRSRRFRAVTGACMLVPREAFFEAGGFDERYANCYEDVDLCLRLGEAGLLSWYCHDAVLYHLESRSRDAGAALEHNEPHFAERWHPHLRQDDVDYYLADRLMSVAPGRESVTVAVAPELGHAHAGVAGIDVEQTLARRAVQIDGMRGEIHRLEAMLQRRAPGAVAYRSNGSRLILEGRDAHAAVVAERGVLVDQLQHKTSPLRLGRVAAAPIRLNILLSRLESSLVFGGYAAALQLGRRVAERGRKVRLVTLDHTPDIDEELAESLEGLEVHDGTDRRVPLAVNPDDSFLATSVWSAHVAHAATRELGGSPFVFLIQDDETLFYPSGSFAAGARAAYELPHEPLFSTELLRDWFALRNLGAGGNGRAGGADPLVFRNAIVDPGAPDPARLGLRTTRRLLFYARPGDTEARNLYEIGVLALGRAIEEDIFDERWEFTGIGHEEGEVPLPRGATLRLLPRQPPPRYRAVLQAHDLGMSLMDSPHPSLVPLEMAAAGMPTVTSTFANKDAAALCGLSPNLIGATPTVEGVLEGLRRAAGRLDDLEGRAAGAGFAWPRCAAEAFDEPTLDRLDQLIEAARPR